MNKYYKFSVFSGLVITILYALMLLFYFLTLKNTELNILITYSFKEFVKISPNVLFILFIVFYFYKENNEKEKQ